MESTTVNETSEVHVLKTRQTPWMLIGLGVLVAILAAQSAVLVLQNQRISDLEQHAPLPGPTGPRGPQGAAGPMGPPGVSGVSGVVVPVPVSTPPTKATAQTTELEARAHCAQLALQAWPDSTSSDPTLQQLSQAYTETMRGNAFNSCMTSEGYPQQS